MSIINRIGLLGWLILILFRVTFPKAGSWLELVAVLVLAIVSTYFLIRTERPWR